MAGGLRHGNKVSAAMADGKPSDGDAEQEGILWATRPFVRLCVALGLVPFRTDALEGGGAIQEGGGQPSSKLHLSYSVAIFIAVAALFCAVAQTHISNRESSTEPSIQSAVELVWSLLSGLVAVVSFAVLIAKRGELQEALGDIAAIGTRIIPEETKLFARVRTLLVSEVVAVCVLVLASAGLQFYGISIGQIRFKEYEVVFQLFSFGATLLLSLQFINQLMLLQQLLLIVNERVAKIRDSFSFSLASREKSLFKSTAALGVGGDGSDSKDPVVSQIVRRYAGFHFALCHLGPRLGNVYGMLALLLSMFDLLDVAFQFYMLINAAINGTSNQEIIYRLGVIFIWSCPKVVTLVFLVAACQSVIEEADQTGVLVSEALLKVKDHQARRELRLFSHQLLHTKVRFTACGFFSLDFSLLTSMTAAVVTHLVILVQFQLAGKEGQPSCNCTVDTNATTAMTTIPPPSTSNANP